MTKNFYLSAGRINRNGPPVNWSVETYASADFRFYFAASTPQGLLNEAKTLRDEVLNLCDGLTFARNISEGSIGFNRNGVYLSFSVSFRTEATPDGISAEQAEKLIADANKAGFKLRKEL